jgi:hypothetical protein
VTIDDLKQLADIEKIAGEALVWIGDPPTEDDYANAGKRRRGGRGGQSRGSGRQRQAEPSRPRRGRRRDSVEATADSETSAEKPRQPRETSRQERPRRKSRQDAAPAPRQQPAENANRTGRRRQSGGGGPAGFQEDTIPAFLQRPVKRARTSRGDAQTDTAGSASGRRRTRQADKVTCE